MPSIISQDAVNHPQLEGVIQTGMKIIGNIVELTDDQNIVNWLLKTKQEDIGDDWNSMTSNMFICAEYKHENDNTRNKLGLNNEAWKYFNFDQMLLDDWKYGSMRNGVDDTYIVIKQDNEYILLEEIHVSLPMWKDREEKLFKEMDKKNVYVVRQA